MYTGCVYDGAHELEGVRRGLAGSNTDYQQWVNSIAAGLSCLTTPKWITTTLNACRKYDFPMLQRLSLSQTRFWRYFERSITRIYQNLSVEESVNISKRSDYGEKNGNQCNGCCY